jgi:hypothetical protein
VGVIFLQAIMETILAFFNHFPLFAIMLRLKDPDRLPGKSIHPLVSFLAINNTTKGGLQFERFQHESFLLEFHGIYHRLKQAWLKLKTKPHTKHTSKKHHRKMAKKRTMISFNVPDDNVSRKKKKHTVKNNRMDATRGSYLWMRVNINLFFFLKRLD